MSKFDFENIIEFGEVDELFDLMLEYANILAFDGLTALKERYKAIPYYQPYIDIIHYGIRLLLCCKELPNARLKAKILYYINTHKELSEKSILELILFEEILANMQNDLGSFHRKVCDYCSMDIYKKHKTIIEYLERHSND